MHSFPQFTHWGVGRRRGGNYFRRKFFSKAIILGSNCPGGNCGTSIYCQNKFRKSYLLFVSYALLEKVSHVINMLFTCKNCKWKKTFCSKKRGPRGRGWSSPFPPPFSFPTALSFINFFWFLRPISNLLVSILFSNWLVISLEQKVFEV